MTAEPEVEVWQGTSGCSGRKVFFSHLEGGVHVSRKIQRGGDPYAEWLVYLVYHDCVLARYTLYLVYKQSSKGTQKMF